MASKVLTKNVSSKRVKKDSNPVPKNKEKVANTEENVGKHEQDEMNDDAKNHSKTVSKNMLFFKNGERVIDPSHGLGQIVQIEERTFNGKTIAFYKIFFEKDNLYNYVPVHKVRDEGVRKLCSKETIKKMLDFLATPAKTVRGTWSKRAQEYDTKMHSGSIMLTAEIVKALFSGVGDPNKSYSERVMYENSLYRIVSEMAAVLKIKEEEAEKQIVSILSVVQASSIKLDNVEEKQDGFDDDDLESYSDKDDDADADDEE